MGRNSADGSRAIWRKGYQALLLSVCRVEERALIDARARVTPLIVRHANLHRVRAPPTAAIFSLEVDVVNAPVAITAALAACSPPPFDTSSSARNSAAAALWRRRGELVPPALPNVPQIATQPQPAEPAYPCNNRAGSSRY
jgi:hypothetical protein